MRNSLPVFRTLFTITALLCLLTSAAFGQRSAAELLSTMAPPSGEIKYTDGIRHINVLDHYLFVTNIWAGLQIIDVGDARAPKQIAFFRSNDEAFATFIDKDYAYMANHSAGVQVFDIRDMNAVRQVGAIEPPGNALYAAAEYPYLFVALGDAGFAIMDITDMNNPVTVKLEIPGEWIQQLHKKDNLLFLAAKRGGLLIYDVSSLENPRLLAQFDTNFNSMMVQVVDEVAYVADGPGGMLAIDVSDPESPQQIARYSDVGFVGNLHKTGNYVYLANRDVGLEIVNISDPARPFLETRYDTRDNTYGVYKKDIYVFLAANTATFVMRHNNSPLLADIKDADLRENESFSLQLEAQEPDGDSIEFNIINLPEGAAFDNQSGYFAWTPTYEQSGIYSGVIFQVIEKTQTRLTVADTVSLNVAHVNRLPDLPAPENQTVAENQELVFTIAAGSDPDVEDQDRLSYRVEKLPDGADFDPATRTFRWLPTFEQSGTYVLDFLIDDGNGGIDREPMTITVNHVDRKPEIANVTAQTVREAEALTLTMEGTELDGEDQNQISFVMENLPEGATFNPSTRIFSWSPTYDQSGTYTGIRAIMTAGALSDTTIFPVRVHHVNRPPLLAEIPAQTVNENEELRFTISGSDPDVEDNGQLSYSATNLPTGAIFDPATQTFTWTPGYEQSGIYESIGFTISDSSGLTDTKTIGITVNHVNRGPQITDVANKLTDENTPLGFQLSAADPDVEDTDSLVFSARGLPAGASLDPKTGMFAWTPTYEQSGQYAVTFVISDGQYEDTTPMSITVNHVNRPPSLAEVAPQTVAENELLRFVIEGGDEDVEDSGLLTYSAAELPEGAGFDPAARAFTWTPTYEQSGNYQVTFSVQDTAGLSDRQAVDIVVTHVNRTPTLAAIPAQKVDENQPLTLKFDGQDPDKEDAGKLVYEIADGPQGGEVDPAGGTFSFTPGFDQSGAYDITAMVRDPSGLSASQTFTLTVNHVNRRPQFAPLAAQSGLENQSLQFSVAAGDPDSEDDGRLAYSADALPEGAVLDGGTGMFSWVPTYDQSGRYSVTFYVKDSFAAGDTVSTEITISHVNRAPTLPAVADAAFRENVSGTHTIPAGSDPDVEDDGKLTYQVEGLPEGAAFDPANRTLSWAPTFDQAGDYQLSAVVTDPDGQSSRREFAIQVENVNRPPAFQAMSSVSGKENELITFSLVAVDPDKEDAGKLTYTAANLPAGASLDAAAGAFTWTPAYDQSGEYQLTVNVKDTFGEQGTATVNISVAHVNRPPVIADGVSFEFREGVDGQAVLPRAEDPDVEDDDGISYRVNGLPNGVSFDAPSRSLRWKPDFDQAGSYTFTYSASDGTLETSAPLELVVQNVNRAPKIESPGDQSVKEGEALSFVLAVSDPDGEDEGKLNVRANNLPTGANFNAGSRSFSWTPDDTQQGRYNVEFVVSDGGDLTAKVTVSIEVEDVPESPAAPQTPR